MIDQVRTRLAAIQSRFGLASTPPMPSPSAAPQLTFQALLAQQQRALQTWAPAPTTRLAGPGVDLDTPTASRRADFQPGFAAAGARYGVDPDLLAAVAWTESGFDPDAVSPAGAIGLMQLMPGTAAELGVDPSNPTQAIDGAARYLRRQLDTFGDVSLALAAYNAGPGAVTRHGGIPPYAETTAYVGKVLGRLQTLRSQ